MLSVNAQDLWQKTAHKSGRFAGLSRLKMSYFGMILGHVGFAFAILGTTLVSIESEERDLRMKPGEEVSVGGYEFKLERIDDVKGANYNAKMATVEVSSNNNLLTKLYPEKRIYLSKGGSPMTEAGIDAGLFRDLYIALGEPLEDGAWAVRIQIKPFIRFIWLGALIMGLGGLVAVSDNRYRKYNRTTISSKEEVLA